MSDLEASLASLGTPKLLSKILIQLGGGDAANASPVNAVAPQITGHPSVGRVLTVSAGSWTGNPTFAYSWKRNGVTISGATANSYLVVGDDVGAELCVVVTATNVGGQTSAASQPVTGLAADPNPVVTTFDVLSGTPGSTVFRVIFSEGVSGVSPDDFFLVATGAITGAIDSVTTISSTTYHITASHTGLTGSVRARLSATGHSISDITGNPFNPGSPVFSAERVIAESATVPGAPTIGTATSTGASTASLSITAPTNTGGAAIAGYRVTPRISNVAQTPITINSTSSPLNITGLLPSTSYTFVVAAINSVGVGADSGASNSITTSAGTTAPGSPTSVSATPGNASASVAFTAPASNGGATITSYTVTASPGGATASGSASPITVSSLTNGTAYTFTVTATNSVGTSNPSSPSAAVTPRTVPGAPTIGVATAQGPTSANVAFTAPASNGGSAITSYTATSSPGGFTGSISQSGSGTITVNGLNPGTNYTFTVTATNAAGTSSASGASNQITTPGASAARYYGASSLTNLNASQIQALTLSNGATNDLTATFTPSGNQYYYYAFPTSFGLLTQVLVTGNATNQLTAWTGNNGTFTSPATVTVEGVPYYLYRTNQLQNVPLEIALT